ncbi:MAG: hypothetical protein IJH75_03015 [Mogibacterium sp.]|nr:hypothetical protein [Mogibacterium sp.]
MSAIGAYLLGHPLVSVAIALAFGDLIGRFQFGKFRLGPTVGTLLVAMIIGGITGPFSIDGNVSMTGFALCVFVIGYEAGPSLVNSLKRTGAKVLGLTATFIVMGTGMTLLLAKVFGLDKGTTAGIFAGSLTQTAVIATAGDAIQALGLDEAATTALQNNVSIAYALTYFFGMAGVMLLIEKFEPWLLKVDLKQEVAKTAEKIGYVEEKASASTGGTAPVRETSDIWFIYIGITIGLIIGAITIHAAGMPLSVGSGVAILIVGMVMGNYAEKHPGKGYIAPGARWFLKIWGLNLFVACVGLGAGSNFVNAFKTMGIKILLIGVFVAAGTHLITMFVGRYLLKMDVVDVLGTQCGASTIIAALNVLVEDTGSSIFALAYAPAYAIGNIVLTMIGPLIIYFMS